MKEEEKLHKQLDELNNQVNKLEGQVYLLMNVVNHLALKIKPDHGNQELHALKYRLSPEDLNKIVQAIIRETSINEHPQHGCKEISPIEFIEKYNNEFPEYSKFLQATLMAIKEDGVFGDFCDTVIEAIKVKKNKIHD